ncbi:MAG: 4-hydroxy-tetrahydrodipicolinate synthase [bacterium (Candidatus Ratteibacteria) CG01_land_8_20_14_3_00_40_19]|uniref:4-hydroxy-tetrahydrodipicolinate synthase n=1 Tax=bacterium (Candidatus Ratteibacteria) CG01_land_8_20_14_3_00_40_19 TaxID=2014290 RepID=A0A2M7E972_9BACT|nr:MAG: 4-hydroxy-tetrahydrodipicolinate synthase [bacterium (Candidatus Ratteibacteria) CG01_land_8_20_14_3_00_40_19]HCG76673.1 4-hydroxy-tetrahydrodipicolinate synthase [bacterium]
MFKGSMVALITPFKGGKIDEKALERLIEFQIKNNTDGIVPCGCTGEAATLSTEEQKQMIKLTVALVKKRIPVIAGTGSNSTKEAIELTKYAESAGADAALLITPYYNKPTPAGLLLHYEKVSSAVSIPIILYNVPSRTGISILPETVAKLSEIENIVAIKEASGSLNQTSEILSLCNITVLSGDDSLTLPILSVGGKGVISVVANIVPADTAEMVRDFRKGKFEEARKLHLKLFPLCQAMFLETNPIPVKTALGMMGMIEPELRLPLSPMDEGKKKELTEALKNYGLV